MIQAVSIGTDDPQAAYYVQLHENSSASVPERCSSLAEAGCSWGRCSGIYIADTQLCSRCSRSGGGGGGGKTDFAGRKVSSKILQTLKRSW
jgi:hypothetical protein